MNSRLLLITTLAMVFPGAAAAQNLPADCSSAAAPKQPVEASIGHLASLRLEFGQRKGDTIPGSIYLCVAKGQTTMFEKTPTKEESYAVGTFQARIEK